MAVNEEFIANNQPFESFGSMILRVVVQKQFFHISGFVLGISDRDETKFATKT